jgi:hypothetical protein
MHFGIVVRAEPVEFSIQLTQWVKKKPFNKPRACPVLDTGVNGGIN